MPFIFKRRPVVEYVAIAWEITILMLGVLTFHFRPNHTVLTQFSEGLGIHVTGDTFAVLCAIFIPVAGLVAFESARWRQQCLYIIASLPLVLYFIAYGWYLASTRASWVQALGYLLIVGPLWLLAFTTFRDTISVVVTSRTGGVRGSKS